MKNSRLRAAMCTLTLAVLTNTAHAAVVNSISGLDIGGTLYDVTFHTGESFNALWDADDDGVFGGGSSVFSTAPTFWGDFSAANTAAASIIAALGTLDETVAGSDGFLVPHGTTLGTPITSGPDDILSRGDSTVFSTFSDTLSGLNGGDGNSFAYQPYVSFTESVPISPALYLFGSGLIGLVGFARRKKV